MPDMPDGWQVASLCMVTEVNPKLDKSAGNDNPTVSFVPMPAVGAGTGTIDVSRTRSLQDVKKGYRHFREGDVLFAKITPCMENGKMAIVPSLKHGLGFGSTEFHVLRPNREISAQYIYYFVSSEQFRRDAQHNMTGAVGQRRVPAPYLADQSVPVPPAREQHRIVAKIEELFSELDKGVESLKTAQAQLKVYRQAVLKHAFEGKLTEQWREENKDKLETPEQLLARIKQEREARYEAQVKEWKVAVKGWEENGKLGGKPTRPKKLNELAALTSGDLPALPKGWVWFKFGDLCSLIRNGISKKPKGRSGKMIFRISAVRAMEFNLDDVRFIADESGEFENYYLQRGDLVFTRYNGSRTYVGVCAEYKSDGSHLYPDKLIRTQLGTSQTLPGYIEKAVNCGASRHFIETRIRTTAGQYGISGSDIKEMPVPLCNLAEQVEIQDRVDEKLSGVSRLLADIEQNLDRAKSLGQSILKKTFSGQLVAQDPSDEPASVLLDRIKAEKEQTCKSGKSPKKTRKKRKTAA